MLEKIIEYEAVHEILDWEICNVVSRRTGAVSDSLPPSLPDEPLIFVRVALCKGLASSVQELIFGAMEADFEADTAVFYSISNCQRGLVGISFGNFLIKQVVHELAAEMPGLRTFATLSPIPGFRKWLVRAAREHRLADEGDLGDVESSEWVAERRPDDDLEAGLLRLCARYLLHEKRGASPSTRSPASTCENGARLERLNWMGDPSPSGLAQSVGMMANYVYDEAEVVANHEAFANEGRIAHSAALAGARGRTRRRTSEGPESAEAFPDLSSRMQPSPAAGPRHSRQPKRFKGARRRPTPTGRRRRWPAPPGRRQGSRGRRDRPRAVPTARAVP